jgi:hypothetical protein
VLHLIRCGNVRVAECGESLVQDPGGHQGAGLPAANPPKTKGGGQVEQRAGQKEWGPQVPVLNRTIGTAAI